MAGNHARQTALRTHLVRSALRFLIMEVKEKQLLMVNLRPDLGNSHVEYAREPVHERLLGRFRDIGEKKSFYTNHNTEMEKGVSDDELKISKTEYSNSLEELLGAKFTDGCEILSNVQDDSSNNKYVRGELTYDNFSDTDPDYSSDIDVSQHLDGTVPESEDFPKFYHSSSTSCDLLDVYDTYDILGKISTISDSKIKQISLKTDGPSTGCTHFEDQQFLDKNTHCSIIYLQNELETDLETLENSMKSTISFDDELPTVLKEAIPVDSQSEVAVVVKDTWFFNKQQNIEPDSEQNSSIPVSESQITEEVNSGVNLSVVPCTRTYCNSDFRNVPFIVACCNRGKLEILAKNNNSQILLTIDISQEQVLHNSIVRLLSLQSHWIYGACLHRMTNALTVSNQHMSASHGCTSRGIDRELKTVPVSETKPKCHLLPRLHLAVNANKPGRNKEKHKYRDKGGLSGSLSVDFGQYNSTQVVFPAFVGQRENCMHYELFRFKSFSSYAGGGSAQRLAKHGFFHIGTKDSLTECYACGIQVCDWTFLEDVELRHRQKSPSCPHFATDYMSSESSVYQKAADAPSHMYTSNILTQPSSSLSQSSFIEGESQTRRPENIQPAISGLPLLANTPPSGAQSACNSHPKPTGERLSELDTSVSFPPDHLLVQDNIGQQYIEGNNNRSRQGPLIQRETQPDSPAEKILRADAACEACKNIKLPHYKEFNARKNSFEAWPPDKSSVSAFNMAYAGLYYTGVGDITHCFCCDGGLKKWEPDDDPLLEHILWFPKCEYMRRLKGEALITVVTNRQAEQLRRVNSGQTPRHQPAAEGGENKTDTLEQTVLKLGFSKDDVKRARSKIAGRRGVEPDEKFILHVTEMGYSEERVKHAVSCVLKNTRGGIVSPEQVLDFLSNDKAPIDQPAQETAKASKRSHTGEEVRRPQVVVEYNKYMGGVDRTDQMVATSTGSYKTQKWWKKVFFHVINVAVLNAYLLYKMTTSSQPPLLQRQFRRQLVQELREAAGGSMKVTPVGRPATKVLDRLSERHFIQKAVPTASGNSKRSCIVCNPAEREILRGLGQQKRRPGHLTSYNCKQCHVPLCVEPCFELYHRNQQYILAYKRWKQAQAPLLAGVEE